jgi:branched-chain amino acid transport system ATP-binding protein
MLEVSSLRVGYGPVEALHGIDIGVAGGELVTLVGANGAGKSTLLRTISGLQRQSEGAILFEGTRIDALSPEARVRVGIAQVPEGRQVFTPLSVEDNLRVGGYTRTAAEREEMLAEVFRIFPVLQERSASPAGALSGGQQQMLAIGRALMARPRLLLLDEPSMGLAPQIADEIYSIVLGLRDRGATILMVEQNALAALEIADRAYVIEAGRIVMEGPASAMLEDDRVRQAYLGLE